MTSPPDEAADQLAPSTAESVPTPSSGKYGMFGGVFTPTLLTILGVIMYLRTGWVVGNAGLVGGLLIVSLSFAITTATALSMSSITTNIRIGAGGAYSIISQSLGLEVGGSVGVPLYLSQALAVTMYIFGFREGWLWAFPDHPALLVDMGTFALIFGIAYASAGLAFRVQYGILAVIIASLISIGVAAYMGSMDQPMSEVTLWGEFPGAPEDGFPGTSFWTVFAVFFPAATGIMAGANMSGELEDPRRSIPAGTLGAIGVSFVVYVLLAIWLARSAPTEALVSNYTIMVDRAYWGPAVVAGLLGATFSSALASTVGAPRILQALGDHDILPNGDWIADRTERGEPRNAILVTGGIVLASLMVRDLNAIAPLITMFFLITYTMINFVVFTEQTLGLVSFRPLLQIPRVVSFLGVVGCLFAMFIVNPTFSLVALAVVIVVYGLLLRRSLETDIGDVRSGLFVSLAEWAAKQVADLSTRQERAWKPNLLVPVESAETLRGTFSFLEDIATPKGSVKLLGLTSEHSSKDLAAQVEDLTGAFRKRGVFASSTIIKGDAFSDGLTAGIQALRGSFFRPNILFLTLPETDRREADYQAVLRELAGVEMGILINAPHPHAGLGQREQINVWLRDRSPNWTVSMDIGNLDLPLLIAYKLSRNWDARMRLLTVVEDPSEREDARAFMERVTDVARMPGADVVVHNGTFEAAVSNAPQADLNIFGLAPTPDFDFMRAMVDETRATCLFVRDSGRESALA
ncbi:MAG: amino acid permease [Salinivenus sp.]